MQEVDFLLTGGSGFLGKAFLEVLRKDFEVKTLDRSISADVQCNLASERPILNNLKIKTVIHAAGKAHVVPRSPDQANEFFQVNFQGTVHLTQSLGINLPQNFIFISTVAVYGLEEGMGIDENHSLDGKTPYALSKIQAEGFLREWCEQNNIKLTVLRLPLVVGVNAPGNLGAIIRWMRRRLYVGIGDGSARRSMVLAEDVARFILQIQKIGGIYNLTDQHHPSVKEIEQAIAKELDVDSPLRLPNGLIRAMAKIGDFLGSWFPINSNRYQKLTSPLTFSDAKAKSIGWNPRSVIHNFRLQ